MVSRCEHAKHRAWFATFVTVAVASHWRRYPVIPTICYTSICSRICATVTTRVAVTPPDTACSCMITDGMPLKIAKAHLPTTSWLTHPLCKHRLAFSRSVHIMPLIVAMCQRSCLQRLAYPSAHIARAHPHLLPNTLK